MSITLQKNKMGWYRKTFVDLRLDFRRRFFINARDSMTRFRTLRLKLGTTESPLRLESGELQNLNSNS